MREFLRLKRRPSASTRAVAIEGAWALRQARAASIPIDVAFVCAELARPESADAIVTELLAAGTDVLEVDASVLCRMADRDGPDGYAAITRLPAYRLADLTVTGETCLVVTAGIEHAGNLGTLIRTADGAGACAVIVTGGRVRTTHPLVVRASIGTAFTVPIVEADADVVVAWLRASGVQVVTADPSAPCSYRAADYRRPLAVVLGSERLGLDRGWREAADMVVSVPMLGVADSLNVAVAGALVLYEAALRTKMGC